MPSLIYWNSDENVKRCTPQAISALYKLQICLIYPHPHVFQFLYILEGYI